MTEDAILLPIKKNKIKHVYWTANTNIGVIDTETFLNNDNIYQIYALGYRTNLSPTPVTYYINNNINSDSIVLTMINELLIPNYVLVIMHDLLM